MTVAVLQFQTEQGPTGAPGSGAAITMLWDTGINDADPGDGQISLNNVDLDSVTAAYIDDLAFGGGDIAAWVDSFGDVGAAALRGTLMLQTVGSPGNFAIYNVIGSVVAGSGYRKVTLEHVSSDGQFGAGDKIAVSFMPAGSDSVVIATGLSAPQFVRDLVPLTLEGEDGVADDPTFDNAAAFAAVIAAAGPTQEIRLKSGGAYAVNSAATFASFTKLRGSGSRIIPVTGKTSGTLVSIPSGPTLQVSNRPVIAGVTIDGGATLDTGTLVGLELVTSGSLIVDSVEVCGCKTGVSFQGAQFVSLRGLKVWNCGVGIYSLTQALGGCNSNTFYDPHVVGCMVGGIFVVASIYPNHSIEMVNPLFIDSKICGVAIFGRQEADLSHNKVHFTMHNGAPEDTDAAGTGAATYSYGGKTVKKASIYASYAAFSMDGQYIAEGHVDPYLIAEDSSEINLHNVRGFGTATARLVKADATSIVNVGGSDATTGTTEGVVNYKAVCYARQKMIVGPMKRTLSDLRNDILSPFTLDPDTTLVSSPATVLVGISGNDAYLQATYTSADGSQAANAFRIGAPQTAGIAVIAFEATSDTDRDFFNGWLTNHKNMNYSLKAGVPTFVAHMVKDLAAAAGTYCFVARAGAGTSIVKYTNVHMFSGNDTPENRAIVSLIMQGHFNAKRWGGVVTKTTTYTATVADDTILGDATGGAFTITLPKAIGMAKRTITIQKIDASGNAVTADGNGSETINGATTKACAAQWDTIRLRSNGVAWFAV